MRMFFPAGLALGCTGLISCGFAFQSNSGSEVKDMKDISSLQDDGKGKFNVVCKDGRREQGVTDEAIKRGDVCKPVPTPTPVSQVNPKAFNAFDIWNSGSGVEILDYPQNYEFREGTIAPDGVFYVGEAAYWKDQKFVGVPTEGAMVVNNVLEYPVKNGKLLKLKFTEISANRMKHLDAVTYCKNKGMRLPTVRELFDFCAAGVTEPNYGPNFKSGKYPSTARCGASQPWSASVYSYFRNFAWRFDGLYGDYGYVSVDARGHLNGVRCVGEP